ncbi:MAG TPA: HEAT repeat domain-containing protein [Acidimicrobiia bacterium]|nr:HEAT repeat domain-containing protein [Acidimicrobiia bacterium]
MTTLGPELGPQLDTARALVVAHGLAAKAFAQLTPVVTELGLSLEALGPVKQLQKRFFSDAPWTADDDKALADAFGPGVDGISSFELEPGLTLLWGWEDGRFRLRVAGDERASDDDPPTSDPPTADPPAAEFGDLFDGVVVPEATPSPRTIRFATPRLHAGPSRAYASAVAATDPRVARLFADFDVVTDVLVGPDFVAVTISRPDRWERVLGPMLHLVNEAFVDGDEESPAPARTTTTSLTPASDPERAGAGRARPPRRLELAWAEHGALRTDRAEDLDRVLAAAQDGDAARRQVAAALLADAPADVAAATWSQLLGDSSRMVRRSVVDTVVDAGREELRALLEQALDDTDAWIRWKALSGIGALGAGPSRRALEPRVADPDFRVRLEATRILADDSSEPTTQDDRQA